MQIPRILKFGGRVRSHCLLTCIFLLGGSLTWADLISTGTQFFDPFATDLSSVSVLLPGFNPSKGTLNSVQLLINLEVTDSTQVFNNTFALDPLGQPILTDALVTASSIAIVTLDYGGFPVPLPALTSPTSMTVLAPAANSPVTTISITTASKSVPSFLVRNFSTLAFAPLKISAQDFSTILGQGIGGPGPSLGAVQPGPTLSTLRGSITAFYDFTPAASAVPEPSYIGTVGVILIGLSLRGRRKWTQRR